MGNKGAVPIQPRCVAVALAYRPTASSSCPDQGSIEICLVSSRKHKDPLRWVLPKGGVEKGETEAEAARRELWEEAGIRAPPSPLTSSTLSLSLSSSSSSSSSSTTNTLQAPFPDAKPHKHSPSKDASSPLFVPRAIYVPILIPLPPPLPPPPPPMVPVPTAATAGGQDSTSDAAVVVEEDQWPERDERERRWVSFDEAVELTRWRGDMHLLLEKSSLNPASRSAHRH